MGTENWNEGNLSPVPHIYICTPTHKSNGDFAPVVLTVPLSDHERLTNVCSISARTPSVNNSAIQPSPTTTKSAGHTAARTCSHHCGECNDKLLCTHNHPRHRQQYTTSYTTSYTPPHAPPVHSIYSTHIRKKNNHNGTTNRLFAALSLPSQNENVKAAPHHDQNWSFLRRYPSYPF